MRPKECPQPFCVLQRDGADQAELVDMGRRLLAGEELSRLRPPPPAESREVCTACVQQIEKGKGPLTWGAEFRGLLAGWTSYRRSHRPRSRSRFS